MLIHPGLSLRREPVDVELARREHRLAVHAVHGVAVDVRVEEHVVRAQLLQLAVARHQGVGIPQADVGERGLVVLELLRRQWGLGRQRLLRDVVELVGALRGGQVAGDVLALLGELIRVDDERLVNGGHDAAKDDHGDDPDDDDERPPLTAAEDVQHEHRCQEQREAHHHVGERQADVDVGVAGAVNGAGGGVQQAPAAEQLADAGHHEDRREDAREMGHGAAAELEVDLRQLRRGGALGTGERRVLLAGAPRSASCAAPGGARRRGLVVDAAHDEVHDGGQHERRDQGAEDVVLQGLPHRQREHIEADVVAEDHVILAERRLFHVQQEGLPLPRGGPAGDHGGQEADAQAADAHPLAHLLAAWLEQVACSRDGVARRQATGELDVELDDDEEDGERRQADQHLPPELRPEHGAEPDLAEPQPVHVEAKHAAGHGEKHHDQRDDDADDDAAPAGMRRLVGPARRARAHWADVVHAPSMSGSRGFHSRGVAWSRRRARSDRKKPPDGRLRQPDRVSCARPCRRGAWS